MRAPEGTAPAATVASAVAAAIWPWRRAPAPLAAPGAGARRVRAAAEAAVMTAVGLLFLLKFHQPIPGGMLLGLAALVLAGGLFIPALYRGFQAAVAWLARAVGIALSWVLLVPFFYLAFTAGRLLLAVSRKDPLQRRARPELKSYWTERKPIAGPEHYTRQY